MKQRDMQPSNAKLLMLKAERFTFLDPCSSSAIEQSQGKYQHIVNLNTALTYVDV